MQRHTAARNAILWENFNVRLVAVAAPGQAVTREVTNALRLCSLLFAGQAPPAELGAAPNREAGDTAASTHRRRRQLRRPSFVRVVVARVLHAPWQLAVVLR